MPNGGWDTSDLDHEYVIKPMQERFVRIRLAVERFRSGMTSADDLIRALEEALGNEGYPPEWHQARLEEKRAAEQEKRDRAEYERLKKLYGS